MKHVTAEDETEILTPHDPAFAPISAHVQRVHQVPVVSVAYQPSEEERAAIAAGAAVYVHSYGLEWTPLRVTVAGTAEWRSLMGDKKGA